MCQKKLTLLHLCKERKMLPWQAGKLYFLVPGTLIEIATDPGWLQLLLGKHCKLVRSERSSYIWIPVEKNAPQVFVPKLSR